MFASFFGLGADDTRDGDVKTGQEESDPATSSAAQSAFPLDLWSVADAVSKTVKQSAGELVKAVKDIKETNWSGELQAFKQEVQHETHMLQQKTVDFVEHLPEQVERIEHQVEEALPAPEKVSHALEEVGGVIASFGRSLLLGTKEFLEEIREGVEEEISVATRQAKRSSRKPSSGHMNATAPAKYSRFEAEVSAMQRDSSTYIDEPSDKEDFERWSSAFSLASIEADISAILSHNSFMADLQSRLVPALVSHEDFWTRYFYRLSKLQQKEEARKALALRARELAEEEEEEGGWEMSDDDSDDSLDSESGSEKPGVSQHTTSTARSLADQAPSPAVNDQHQGIPALAADAPTLAAAEAPALTALTDTADVVSPESTAPGAAADALTLSGEGSPGGSSQQEWCVVAAPSSADTATTDSPAASCASAAAPAEVDLGEGSATLPTAAALPPAQDTSVDADDMADFALPDFVGGAEGEGEGKVRSDKVGGKDEEDWDNWE